MARTEGNQGTAEERISFQQAAAELQEEETDSQQHAVETLTEGGQEKQKAQLRTAELAGGVPCWETERNHSKMLLVSDRSLGRRVCFQTSTFRIMFAPR